MQQQLTPLALLFSSLAYFFNSVQDIVPEISLRQPSTPLRRSGFNIFDRTTVLVDTGYGTLKGLKEISRIGKRYYSFRGKDEKIS